jgi:hypothetical protein
MTGGLLALSTLALTAGAALPAHADEATRAQAAQVLARFAAEPDVLEVQRVAAQYARLHPGAYESWGAASTWAYLLPDKLEGTVYSSTRDDRDVRVSGSTRSTSELAALEDVMRMQLAVRWNLSKLVFNTQKITASKEAARLTGLREDLLTTINKLYFGRRELQAEMVVSPPTDLRAQIRQELRIRGLTADLDALTGGWFSKAVEANTQAKGAPAPTDALAAGVPVPVQSAATR